MQTLFVQKQMDYILFCYGLAFILLAAVCVVIRQEKRQPLLPLGWLALFGVTHGLHEWLDMLAFSLNDSDFFSSLRLCLMTLSFVFLVEFSRAGLHRTEVRGPAPWIYVPLLLIPLGGAATGLEGLNAMVRLSLGLLSCLLAAWLLFRSSLIDRPVRGVLTLASISMLLYAFATGLVVPGGAFLPASVMNYEAFLSFAGIPIQAVRTVLAMAIAASLWEYHRQFRWGDSYEVSRETEVYGLQFAAALLIFLAIGWVLTNKADRDRGMEERNSLLKQARIAASAMNARDFKDPASAVSNRREEDHSRLQRELLSIAYDNPHLERLYLLRMKDDQLTLATAASRKSLPDLTVPRLSPEQRSVLQAGMAATTAPGEEDYGGFVSAFVPLHVTETGRTVMILGMDLNQSDFLQKVARSRLSAILTTLLVSILFIGFNVLRQRLWESSQVIAAKEKRLADAQRIANLTSWTLDPRTEQITWEEMPRGFDLSPEDSPRSYSELNSFIHPEDWKKLDAAIKRATKTGKGYELDLRVIMPDGSMKYLVSRGEGKRSVSGEVSLLAGTLQDITARKWAEDALRTAHADLQKQTEELSELYLQVQSTNEKLAIQTRKTEVAKRQAEQANKAKSDFLANMSHELRTPLNSVLGFSDVLLMGMTGELTAEQKDLIGTIKESGEHLLNLINDILDLAKIEAGKLELKLSRTKVSDIVRNSMLMLKEKANRQGVTLNVETEPEDMTITADAIKLKQIIYNLLSNAVKFTPAGGTVTVTTRTVTLPDNSHGATALLQAPQHAGQSGRFLEISVADTGIGIKEEDMQKLFQKFSQIEAEGKRNSEGTGLGLALSRKLVELHKGVIWAESEYGRGSRFSFVIPLDG